MKGLSIAIPFLLVASASAQQAFRPVSVPLVTHNPNFSIWSGADRLTDETTRHWTRHPHPLTSFVRIDGSAYRMIGDQPAEMPTLEQTALRVTPTQSIYTFATTNVEIELRFTSPVLPDDLDIFSRPVTYVTLTARALDGRQHKVQWLGGIGSEVAVDNIANPVESSLETAGKLTLLKVGAQNQTILRPAGDDTRVNWGYAYLASTPQDYAVGDPFRIARNFARAGKLPRSAFVPSSVPVQLAAQYDLGNVSTKPVSRFMMLGYDEIYAIEYFGQRLPPYWRRKKESSPAKLFAAAEKDYRRLLARCDAFDRELTDDATKVGGQEYAQILALAYRECVAANGLAADSEGKPLFFTKENTSNGDIATVDVIFPMAPVWLLLSPTLMKASLESNFAYAASPRWQFPNAPHDLGNYPQVFGRDDGGEGMPVEESGNMILMADAIAHAEGNPKYANRWWGLLTKWAEYLEKYGLDPENQLCTDDFMGHLAHNANLSVKAILALGAYGDLCKMRGDSKTARKYFEMARKFAAHWVEVADAGDHSLLAFDKPGTWSQKYNLVWDKLLGLGIFPPEIARKEVAFYKKQLLPYGLPLDSRTKLTKSDWSIWSATMAESDEDFRAFVSPIYKYIQETTTRDPIADSYITDDKTSGGMHARPVVGGFFIKLLADKQIWDKWVDRDRENVTTWAPIPKVVEYKEVVPTKQTWAYTFTKPDGQWAYTTFDDTKWLTGPAGFGTADTPGITNATTWDTSDIWIRRSFEMPKFKADKLRLIVYHDEDVEVYVNGLLALRDSGFTTRYEAYEISPAVLDLLRSGQKVTIAVHCHQTSGGQGVDVGFGEIKGK